MNVEVRDAPFGNSGVRFNCEGRTLKPGSGKWRLSGKVGRSLGGWSRRVDVGATHTQTQVDDLGQIWEGDSYQPLNFPAHGKCVTNFDYESTERQFSLLASGHLHGRRYAGN